MFEGLKEQLKDNWADLSSKIQENSTFNNLREKFEAQSPTVQKAILAGAGIFFALFMFSFPWGYISTSMDNMTAFDENRTLIQGLLHASRAAKEPSPLPPPMGPDLLRSRVDMILRDNRLVPEQIGEMQVIPDKPAGNLAPAVVLQAGLAVQLKKLNLDQIMNLALQFQTMSPGTKLMGLDVTQSAGQDHYYDMNARIVNFGLPAMAALDEGAEGGGRRGKAPPKRPARNSEDEETGE